MKNYNKHYENEVLWLRSDFDRHINQEKANLVLNWLPKDVKTIIDIGCGDGDLLHYFLNKDLELHGADLSATALAKVDASIKKYHIDLQSEQNLGQYDLAMAFDVLEHLTDSALKNAVNLLKKSRLYIVVNVPNDECLLLRRVMCDHCYATFHPYRHLNSFNVSKLNKLFEDEFEISFHTTMGPSEPYSIPLLLKLSYYIGNSWMIVPSSTCPQCGKSPIYPPSKNVFGTLINQISRLIQKIMEFTHPPKKEELIVCFKRKMG